MLIKKLHRNVFDVFLGKGFDHWSRVKRTHFGITVIAGQKLPHNMMRQITEHL